MKKETLEQIDQNNHVTRGSTALAYKKETLSGFEEGHKVNLDWIEQNSNRTKQETTLEEAIERLFIHYPESSGYIKAALIGKEWQQERSYSEEEVFKLILTSGKLPFANDEERIEWFEQFKKK